MAVTKAEFIALADELFDEFGDFLQQITINGAASFNVRDKEYIERIQTIKAFKLNKKETFSINSKFGNSVEIPTTNVNFLAKYKDLNWVPAVNNEKITDEDGEVYSINSVFVDPGKIIVVLGCK